MKEGNKYKCLKTIGKDINGEYTTFWVKDKWYKFKGKEDRQKPFGNQKASYWFEGETQNAFVADNFLHYAFDTSITKREYELEKLLN